MTGLTADLDGAERLSQTLGAAGERLGDLTAVHQAAGRAVLQTAQIPVATGALKASAAVAAGPAGFALTATVPYAAGVHARNPFFTRALDAQTDQVIDQVIDHVDDVVHTIQGA